MKIEQRVPAAPTSAVRADVVVLAAFAGFGVIWGMYAAAIPAIRDATAVSDAFLGTALSGVGLTALPAMLMSGRFIDRAGRTAFTAALVLFAISAPLALVVTSAPALVAALLVFGGCSGAYDVAINHAAVAAEAATGRRVLNRAHAVFSLGLLAGSLLMGAARGAGMHPGWPLVAAGLLLLAGAVPAWRNLTAIHAPAGTTPPPRGRGAWAGPMVWVAGLLGVLALLVESGLQQWSAVFLEDNLHTAPGLSSLGPAIFAASAATGRMAGHFLGNRLADIPLLVCSGLLVCPGVLVLATADHTAVALAGLLIAGAGISVGSPTLYGFAGRRVPASERGRTVAVVSGIAYVGLLGGPGVVGQIAAATTLRTAFAFLAAAALLMAIGSLSLRRWAKTSPSTSGSV
ncbi:MFS transporter [Nonomuraea sp. NPDC026600]|uniref:MFS transporter n=1 Tax=Nonomuraea sp. NPDC026600 TaxID=3155363 RepID=UPI0033F713BF